MSSNKHHELAKLVMAQVSDLLVDYSIKQANSFVNIDGQFPKLIKFDYLGKYSKKRTTLLMIEAGLEIAADYTYFNTRYTWRNTKKKYYISNFGCYRNNLIPATDESFIAKTYELKTGLNGLVDVEQIRQEIAYFFLPYLEKLTNLDDLAALMHWQKPTHEQLHHAYQHHSFFYNWLTVIYLLLTEERYRDADVCIKKIIYVACLLDQLNQDWQFGESLFVTINKFQKDFRLNCLYRYDERQRRIVFSDL